MATAPRVQETRLSRGEAELAWRMEKSIAKFNVIDWTYIVNKAKEQPLLRELLKRKNKHKKTTFFVRQIARDSFNRERAKARREWAKYIETPLKQRLSEKNNRVRQTHDIGDRVWARWTKATYGLGHWFRGTVQAVQEYKNKEWTYTVRYDEDGTIDKGVRETFVMREEDYDWESAHPDKDLKGVTPGQTEEYGNDAYEWRRGWYVANSKVFASPCDAMRAYDAALVAKKGRNNVQENDLNFPGDWLASKSNEASHVSDGSSSPLDDTEMGSTLLSLKGGGETQLDIENAIVLEKETNREGTTTPEDTAGESSSLDDASAKGSEAASNKEENVEETDTANNKMTAECESVLEDEREGEPDAIDDSAEKKSDSENPMDAADGPEDGFHHEEGSAENETPNRNEQQVQNGNRLVQEGLSGNDISSGDEPDQSIVESTQQVLLAASVVAKKQIGADSGPQLEVDSSDAMLQMFDQDQRFIDLMNKRRDEFMKAEQRLWEGKKRRWEEEKIRREEEKRRWEDDWKREKKRRKEEKRRWQADWEEKKRRWQADWEEEKRRKEEEKRRWEAEKQEWEEERLRWEERIEQDKRRWEDHNKSLRSSYLLDQGLIFDNADV